MPEVAMPAVRNWNFPRGIASIALLVEFGAAEGVPAEDLLSASGLAIDDLTDPALQVTAQQELVVVRNLTRALGERPSLGLDVGCRYNVTTFGIFGFACLSSPTLRDAIALALRYLDLSFAFCTPTVELASDEIRMELHDRSVPEDVRDFLVDRDLAAIVTVMNDLLGSPILLHRMMFRQSAPPSTIRYEELFGSTPTFDAASNISTFDIAYLDRPLRQGNRNTVALCEAQCRELVARRRKRSGIAGSVRDELTRIGDATVDMDSVAAELGMSSRTMRRRLDDAGTSFRALRDEVLATLAVEMLDTGVLSVEDVAVRLGYAESSSFIYAFKRWFGETPLARHRAADSRQTSSR
ncbi:AraC family transcriptional regulator [Antrihabitans cavernicola]|uniref:AraC family transcriptional regulator n=1 Tax=Antrihabitans cavernicola TaxID=2495913 RepID=A0A5A7S8W4_9NOCA|nr:AraC family transcriptional regulator [Spelaeibacter cavernicola]KAA0021659.1 AraC family transcriptional regulator [Spelaeibacter cavernicola]